MKNEVVIWDLGRLPQMPNKWTWMIDSGPILLKDVWRCASPLELVDRFIARPSYFHYNNKLYLTVHHQSPSII